LGSLSIAGVVLGAFRIVWLERANFLRSLAVPGLLLVLLFVGWSYADAAPMWLTLLAFALYGALFAVYAVICHRLVLLAEPASRASWMPWITGREVRFLAWLAAVWVMAIGSMLAVVTVLANLLPSPTLEIGESMQVVSQVTFRAGTSYVFARLCMVLPAAAIDRRPSVKWSWNLTRGNGWKLAVIVGVLPWVIKEALALLFREEATFIETLLLATAAVALIAVEVAAVLLSYRELAAKEIG
jgi:hypothetical protein